MRVSRESGVQVPGFSHVYFERDFLWEYQELAIDKVRCL